MIKMLRDAHDDAGNVMYKAGEIVCATGVEEDILVRRGYADWEEVPAVVVADAEPIDTDNAAVEGADE